MIYLEELEDGAETGVPNQQLNDNKQLARLRRRQLTWRAVLVLPTCVSEGLLDFLCFLCQPC